MNPVPLPLGWGEAALFQPGETPWKGANVTRSYDHGGACLAWRVPAGMRGACDMERLDVDTEGLAHRFGATAGSGFLQTWVAVEASAKLHDVPILLWLKRHGLARDPALPLHSSVDDGRTMALCLAAVPE